MQFLKRIYRALSRRERGLLSFLVCVFGVSLLLMVWNSRSSLGKAEEGVYTEGVVGEIIHINPLFADFSPADADLVSLVFSGLVKYNSETETFEEDIATHTLSEDKLVYTFTLKENIFWHDGTPVTAADIYFTFAEVIQSPEFKNPLLKANFEGITVTQIDGKTVTFTLTEPNSFFFSQLTLGILPKHILGDTPVAQMEMVDFNKHPIGTGPYQVTAPYTLNEDGTTSVNLSAFPDYYGEPPQIQELRFITFPTLEELVENRDIWNGAARIKQEFLTQMDLEDLEVYPYELPQYIALFFNTESPILDERLIRIGLSKAIDKSKIIQEIGYLELIDTPLLELSQDDWYHTPNLVEAQGALFDSGWKLTEGQPYRSNEEGDTLTLTLIRRDFSEENPTQEAILAKTAELIQSELQQIGVEVIIIAYPVEILQQKILDRDYDMILYGQNLGYNLDTFAFWHSSQAYEGLNLSNFQNPSADNLIESIRGTFDPAEKQSYLNELATLISEEAPAVFLYTPTYYYLVDQDVQGISFKKLLIPSDRFSNISSWFFK